MAAARGRDFRDVRLTPSGLERGLEEVLIVMDGVHQLLPPEEPSDVPAVTPSGENSQLLPAPDAGQAPTMAEAPTPTVRTDADRVLDRYRKIGQDQGHQFGSGGVPNFNAPIRNTSTAATTGTNATPIRPPNGSAPPVQ
jgi:rod shape-determining protein MreC